MDVDILFSSHLFGGRITPPPLFLLPLFVGAIFWQNRLEREKGVVGGVSYSSGLPGGKATPGSFFLKIQIP